MDQSWKQLFCAFLMGILMPGLAMQLGRTFAAAGSQSETQPQTQPDYTQTIQTTQVSVPESVMLPVLLADHTLRLMELDTYLEGVVLAEMPATFEEEALKAQAVAARTWSLRCTREGVKHPGGAVCTDSTCCQSYMDAEAYLANGGTQKSVDKIRKAVRQTAGQVLTYQNELIDATYFSCSGGKTEDAAAVWGADIPYLQSVESPGEERAEVYSSTVCFSAAEFASLLGRTLSGDCAGWLGKVTHTEGGGVATMVVAGKTYTGSQLRELLSLNSTAFAMTADEQIITVTTSGRGHRVGMSQYGADAMALMGSTYEEILAHYYHGTRIDKLETVG